MDHMSSMACQPQAQGRLGERQTPLRSIDGLRARHHGVGEGQRRRLPYFRVSPLTQSISTMIAI
jgi:hypothetical protein